MAIPKSQSLTLETLSLASPDEAPTAYLYTSLSNTRNEIRLLEILPRSSNNGQTWLECRLLVKSLDDKPSYTALSYVWGDAKQTRPISVDGYEVQVTTNLADALYQLREESVQILWADALCINQQDDVEKGHQVQKMGDIFATAKEVIAWLGLEGEGSKRAIQMMKELARVAESADLRNIFSPHYGDVPPQQRSGLMKSICRHLVLPSPSGFAEEDLGLIMTLMERKYWTRVWVIQETCLANNLTLLCGTDRIRWNDTQKAMAVIQWLKNFFIQRPDGFEAFQTRLRLLHKPFRPEGWVAPPAAWLSALADRKNGLCFRELLSITCQDTKLESFDPKDRIYALLGLLHKEDRGLTPVDYSKSYTDLYLRATLFMLRNYGSKPLVYAGFAYREKEDEGQPGLPSWVVDWRCTRLRGEGLLSLTRYSTVEFPVRALGDSKITFAAASAGRIVEVIPYPTPLRQIVERFTEARRQHRLLPSQPVKDIIWRTLLYDRWVEPLSPGEVSRLFEESTQPPSPKADSRRLNVDDKTIPTAPPSKNAHTFEQLVWNECPRNLFMTAEGKVGSGPPCTQIGDVIHAVLGLELPLLLRPDGVYKDKRQWKLMGPAYVVRMVSVDEEDCHTLEEFWATNPETEEIILT